ncbi:hypothetical protein HD553DRAFT_325741 [Filobasidium floriforme]|uniref:uncharacterized protein n=1 Tax=Filobasidium floriforme TaxID=5210 RepID=UPI001E8D40BC|nr:uncharacterized protein HD553DRAFT_325741 [Filobasidium floriforme]KAH8080766.1 hypothetical protein HD553DRAFT_325741 [Filobasidium floriforme]
MPCPCSALTKTAAGGEAVRMEKEEESQLEQSLKRDLGDAINRMTDFRDQIRESGSAPDNWTAKYAQVRDWLKEDAGEHIDILEMVDACHVESASVKPMSPNTRDGFTAEITIKFIDGSTYMLSRSSKVRTGNKQSKSLPAPQQTDRKSGEIGHVGSMMSPPTTINSSIMSCDPGTATSHTQGGLSASKDIICQAGYRQQPGAYKRTVIQMSDLNQHQPKWKWVVWKGKIKMEAAEELNKPSPFGQEEEKWTALRNDLNGNLEAIVQEVQVHHLDLGGKNLQKWTDSSWREFYTEKQAGRLEGWKQTLEEQATESMDMLNYHPGLLLEPSIKIDHLSNSRIKCVAAYCIGRGHVDGNGTSSKGHSLYCTMEFGFERKPVVGNSPQQRRFGFPGSTVSGESGSDGSSATRSGATRTENVALEPNSSLEGHDDSLATQKSSMR